MIHVLEVMKVRRRGEGGFTLIELLVAMGLFGILTTILFSIVLNSANTVTTTRQSTDINEEARAALNRISREVREAKGILGAVNPVGSTFSSVTDTAITFEVDLSGNDTIELDEIITYRYEFANKRLVLKTGNGLSAPVLAANVENFRISYFSQVFNCDDDKDGTITWEEVDSTTLVSCPIDAGNSNGILDVELTSINRVVVELSLLKGSRRQDYRTQIDLRNRPL
ncbi:MAG: prepilin-type N-terminal cleavage/methylation domain-containing protein [Actinomycetota bacterium]